MALPLAPELWLYGDNKLTIQAVGGCDILRKVDFEQALHVSDGCSRSTRSQRFSLERKQTDVEAPPELVGHDLLKSHGPGILRVVVSGRVETVATPSTL
jgi:hypothetical protein